MERFSILFCEPNNWVTEKLAVNKEHFGGSCKFSCSPGRLLADCFASLRRAFLTGSQWFCHVRTMPLLIGNTHFVSEAFSLHLELKQMGIL